MRKPVKAVNRAVWDAKYDRGVQTVTVAWRPTRRAPRLEIAAGLKPLTARRITKAADALIDRCMETLRAAAVGLPESLHDVAPRDMSAGGPHVSLIAPETLTVVRDALARMENMKTKGWYF
jgi:hypothetical protein